ncbi:FadR/GntR family transcriptional regulator [Gordonia sp. KTR9]|uniref:FadR/GntR family transcriptional regulator n=1 Tax=Gordonia sp. KTR9 TaxID=337191 RepID=UPI0001DD94DB|nr:FCD domain-containing protein [Gordonia sp. KTR9]ADK69002.1 Transcriptional regulators [Gordonia sp. KTR9]
MQIGSISLLTPLGSFGRADEIAQRLSDAITIGLIGAGEQFPTEVDLAQLLGVSPMTLREAMAVLRDEGLVETRRGRNGWTFVIPNVEPPEVPDLDQLRSFSLGGLRDLGDEHLAVGGQSARLAASRATPLNLRRIAVLVDQLDRSESRSARIRADSRFHIEIAVATRSSRLLRREVTLQAEMCRMLWLPQVMSTVTDFASVVSEHRAVVEAIDKGDPDEARHAAEGHIHANIRRLATTRLTFEDDAE